MQIEFENQNLNEFLSNCAKRFCPKCGAPITENPNGRKKKFCSSKCRLTYWKYRYRHRDKNAPEVVNGNG